MTSKALDNAFKLNNIISVKEPRFGAAGDGVTDDSAAIQAALDSLSATGGKVFAPPGTYNLGTTGITIPSGVGLVGAGRAATNFTYSGTGIAIDGFSSGNLPLGGFSVTTSDTAATGMRLGDGCQHIILDDIALYGDTSASNTGTGLLLEATGAANVFCGHLSANLFYSLGYKHAIRCVGTAVGGETWTTMSFTQTYLIGRDAGIIAGSTGISFDANTNASGSTFIGGLIEAFDTGLSHVSGGTGPQLVVMAMEGNNTNFVVGDTFIGQIINHGSNPSRYEASANGAANPWYKKQVGDGIVDTEAYYSQRHVIKQDPGPSEEEFGVYFGDSHIDGGSPTWLDGVKTVGTFANPHQSYKQFGTHKVSYGTTAPTAGNWTVGDICYNSTPDNTTAVKRTKYWTCTVAGTPGTWLANETWTDITLSAAASSVFSSITGVTTTSTIILMPTNAAAATLMGAATSLYVSARGAGTFTLTTANGAAAAGTETFHVRILN